MRLLLTLYSLINLHPVWGVFTRVQCVLSRIVFHIYIYVYSDIHYNLISVYATK